MSRDVGWGEKETLEAVKKSHINDNWTLKNRQCGGMKIKYLRDENKVFD